MKSPREEDATPPLSDLESCARRGMLPSRVRVGSASDA